MLVEDENIVAMNIRFSLQALGYQVAGQAASAEDAVRKAIELRPDLILMDIKLRGTVDGISAAQEISTTLDVPFIFLTAFADEKTLERARQIGPYGYLIKPFDDLALNSAIEIALYKHGLERKLKESEERWRALARHAPNLIIIADRDGRIQFINRTLGDGDSQQAGEHTIYDYMSSAESARISQILKGVFETGQPAFFEVCTTGLDGNIHWMETQVGPIFKDGQITALSLIATDVTDRKEQQEALRSSEEKYRSLFETMAQGVVYQDAEGNIFSANPAAQNILGMSLEQLTGRDSQQPQWRSIHEDGSPIPDEEHPAMIALRTGVEVRDVVMGVFNPQDQDWRWINISATPQFKHGQEKPFQVFTTFGDITRIVKAERALARRWRAEKVVAEMSADLLRSQDIEASIGEALAKIGQFMEAHRASLFSVGESKLSFSRTHEWLAPGEEDEGVKHQSFAVEDYSWLARTFIKRGSVLVHTQDLPVEAERESLRSINVQTLILVTMDFGNGPTRVLALSSPEVKAWNEEDLDLLRVVIEILNIALDRQRAEKAEQIARQQSDTLRLAASALSSELDLDHLLGAILNYLEKVIDYTQACVLLREDDSYLLKARRGEPSDPGGLASILTQTTILKEISHSREPLVIEDVSQDERFHRLDSYRDVHSLLGLPLIAHGQAVGMLIILSNQIHTYGQTEARLAQAFADHAAIAIENAQLYRRSWMLAVTDSLTGLYNRRHFFNVARSECERSRRYQRSLSLVMMDIDHFKLVNDTHGHTVGDVVLSEVANRLTNNIRSLDILARYGGEEFVVLMPETNIENATHLAERLRASLGDSPIIVDQLTIQVTISLGVAELGKECEDLQSLLNCADRALYQAKQAGRNRVSIFR